MIKVYYRNAKRYREMVMGGNENERTRCNMKINRTCWRCILRVQATKTDRGVYTRDKRLR